MPLLEDRSERVYQGDEPVALEVSGNAALYNGDRKLKGTGAVAGPEPIQATLVLPGPCWVKIAVQLSMTLRQLGRFTHTRQSQ